VPADLDWSDVGTWEAFYNLADKDSRGNALMGRAEDMDSRNCLVFTQNRLVATIGLEDIFVVDTADASLVCHRDRVQDVKNLVERLSRQNLTESVHHPMVERPWGRYTVVDAGPGFQVKQLEVASGQRLSLQLHEHRAEHWVVVQGQARITIGKETKEVATNESVFVPLRTPHRLENPGPGPLRIIEVQTGSYLGEDDIVRLDDDFWRVSDNKENQG